LVSVIVNLLPLTFLVCSYSVTTDSTNDNIATVHKSHYVQKELSNKNKNEIKWHLLLTQQKCHLFIAKSLYSHKTVMHARNERTQLW